MVNKAWREGSRRHRLAPVFEKFMATFSFPAMTRCLCLVAVAMPLLGQAQGNYAAGGGEFNIAGELPGEQMYPQASITTSGGYLVWEDNRTDGFGLGISALKLDSSLSGLMSSFRVNVNGNHDQERPSVAMLKDGGAVFIWEGGEQGFQHIYARFRSASGEWLTEDVQVNTPTNVFQLESSVATLANGNVVVVWSSFNQVAANSLRDVYFQIFTPAGARVGGETRVNQFTTFNQRSAAVAALSDGRFVVTWVSEQQRAAFNLNFNSGSGAAPAQTGAASVDVYARLFNASGSAVGGEILVNTDMNVSASPTVGASSDGGFAVAWMRKDTQTATNSWDIFMRPFSGSGIGGAAQRINTWVYGDQLAPRLSAMGTDYLLVWTSMGQDGSREGVYGQFLRGDGTLLGAEFRVNSTVISQQMQPAVASDGVAQFLTVWTSFVGGNGSFDLQAQRYFNTASPLPPPGAPMVNVLSSNSLNVTWSPVQGLSLAHYEVFADGTMTATALVTNNFWTATALAPASTHSYRLAYVLNDGRRSPLSGATTNTTYSAGATWGGVPQEWMAGYFGGDFFAWPSPYVDSDGDGASNKDEFLAGTNPTDVDSVLRQRLVQTPQGPFLNWNTEPGLVYQVQMTADMSNWGNLAGPRFAAGYLDSMFVGDAGPAFYRIIRLR